MTAPNAVPVSAKELARLKEHLARLMDYVLMDANCPCCDRNDVCDQECTFAEDNPNDVARMEAARYACKVT